jgi:hypothetical protein
MKLAQFIHNLYNRDNDSPWNGYLYRASKEAGGHLYHTDPEGAQFYTWNEPQNVVRVYECPDIVPICLYVDSGDDPPVPTMIDGVLSISLMYLYQITGEDPDEEDDWVNVMDRALPILTKQYPGVVIVGETGAQVTGFPVEVALAVPPQETHSPAAIATLIDT